MQLTEFEILAFLEKWHANIWPDLNKEINHNWGHMKVSPCFVEVGGEPGSRRAYIGLSNTVIHMNITLC